MSQIQCIVYVSSAVRLLNDLELQTLLSKARARNAQLGITGLLLYCDGNFMQYIEGPQNELAEVYGIIKRDPLHHQLIELANEARTEREFEDWAMAFRVVDTPTWMAMALASWDDTLETSIDAAPATFSLSLGRAMLKSFWAKCNGSL